MMKSDAAQAEPEGFQGKKNIYVCEKCKGHIVTVDLERGVTPFMVDCRATHGCKGMMKSSMYRVFDQEIRADHEWYRPTAIQTLSPWERDHVSRGGLLLRKAKHLSVVK
ncbi:hypothetical protein IVB40_07540 [Bradyrhizobium sp. 40]|uniref:hypothetical protein n=1 Tax=Bradyrhizobium sp. 40 TaxID=2782674 RepID=UPI001FFE3003|nr:hypothetical protein [Bradyrhizobium sp. 40]UPJ43913.1 hypothetical protein IVB40_07540 [Bradyrhizobium sp. 40]